MTAIKLRDYQETAVQEIRAAFRAQNWPVLFVLPTGGGKTFTFSYIAASGAEKGRRICIIVHRKELLLQASGSLRALGIEHGMISPHFTPNRHAMIQVASVDTLLKRIKKYQDQCALAEKQGRPKPPNPFKFDIVIFDEAHHVMAENKWGACWELMGRPMMLGVTATPVRTDGKGLGEHAGGVFKSMVLGPLVQDLIDRGSLIKPVIYAGKIVPDFKGIRKDSDGDYNRRALAERTDKPMITGSAVEHYKEICPGAKTIVFCSSIKHARNVRDEFNAAGFRFELLVGEPEMSDAERTAVNRKLRRGEIDGACTVDLVSEGYDLPDLECCIMLRLTASEALFLQQVGRIMRPSENKRGCWLLDHVGNVGRWVDGEWKEKHGLPNKYREWTLDGRKKRKKGEKDEQDEEKVELKQCPNCYLVHEPAPKCPGCGHEYPAAGRRGVEQVDGKLQQITEEMEAQQMRDARIKQGKARTKEELAAIGIVGTRADKILEHRVAKEALQTALISDLQAWRQETGETALDILGVPTMAIKNLKPKQLKELRQRFDEHRAKYLPELSLTGSQSSGQAALI